MGGDIAIRIEGLGKRYRLGQSVNLTRTFRETLVSLPRHLGQRLRGSPAAAPAGTGAGGGAPPGWFWALRGVSFEVPRGEVIGIIGRNGAGKSTLLKILSRITVPTEGRVEMRGRLASLLEVGTGFHPELTGRENIYLNGAILGMRRAEIAAKFDEIVAFAEIEKFLDTPVKRYSSGMYVRLAFAVAAHLEPEILVVDEVLAVGDAEFQRKCLGKMESVATGGRTVLFVSHNMQAVRRLCTRGVLLHEGTVQSEGEITGVIDAYLRSSAHQEPNAEITPDMHRTYPPAYEIHRVEIRNAGGEATATLLMDERFTLRLHGRAHRPVQGLRVGVTFRGGDGARLATIVASPDGGISAGTLQGAEDVLTAQIENVFMPGPHSLDISVKSGGGDWVDFIEGIQFTVAPVSSSGREPILGGYVRLDAQWSHAGRRSDAA